MCVGGVGGVMREGEAQSTKNKYTITVVPRMTTLTLKAPKIMHLKMSSAEVVCCK